MLPTSTTIRPKNAFFFYGVGGNGKSLLLRFLRESCCKRLRPENWEHLETLSDDEFLAQLQSAEDTDACPAAALDFVQPDDRHPFEALLKLDRILTGSHGLRFPLFDFACVWYLKKTERLDKEQLRNLFPSEEMDFIFGIVDACLSSTWGNLAKAALSLFHKHLATGMREDFTLWMQKRKLDAEQLLKVQNMDPNVELSALARVFRRRLEHRDVFRRCSETHRCLFRYT